MITSEFILSELAQHLPGKFKAISEADARVATELIRRRSIMVTPAEMAPDICRDADDLPVLGTAVAGDARFLVTGDKDLLCVARLNNIEILSPRAFLDRLRS